MGVLQFVNYMHNNLYRNDWPLYHAGLTFGSELTAWEYVG